MEARKRKRLEAAGWRVGGAADSLELSTEEVALVENALGGERSSQRAPRSTISLAYSPRDVVRPQPNASSTAVHFARDHPLAGTGY